MAKKYLSKEEFKNAFTNDIYFLIEFVLTYGDYNQIVINFRKYNILIKSREEAYSLLDKMVKAEELQNVFTIINTPINKDELSPIYQDVIDEILVTLNSQN